LQGKIKIEIFDIKNEIRAVAKVSAITANRAGVKINLKLPKGPALLFEGDTLRFRQVVINLMSNAVEAYKDMPRPPSRPTVDVAIRTDKHHAIIEVTDHGPGIPIKNRDSIFDPFYTSKAKGVGIGLFIVRQVVDRDLKGDVRLAKTGPAGTTFAVRLPLKNRLGDPKENHHAH
jgi:C4-dicarboxylate-specific signal transduction histidine kinase